MPIASYGTWESPLSSDVLARGNVRYGSVELAADGSLYFSELRSFEQGRTAIVRLLPDGTREEILPAPFSARTRVHEYGGRSFLLHGSALYFVEQSDQQLYRLEAPAAAEALTHEAGTRFAEPVADPRRPQLIAVAERHGAAREPENFLARVQLADGAVTPLVQGRSFYAAPAFAPDGSALAFLCWDHPHMPWDAAELWLARLAADGGVAELSHVAGDSASSV
jgi:hypothetical protein